MQKLSRNTVLEIPLRTLETMPIAFRIFALTQFHTFKFKNIGQNRTERLIFYIKGKIITTNSLKAD